MAVRVPRRLRTRDPVWLARAAGLRFLTDDVEGIRRRRCGRGVSFVDPSGLTVRGADRRRLVELAVPPMWEDVWFSPAPDGHLQASGRDAAARKQHRYHDDFRALCERLKFERLGYFARALPALRDAVEVGLAESVGTRAHAVAAAIRTIDVGLLRVGNEESAASGRYGATTLESDHATEPDSADDGYIVLDYTAKSGAVRSVAIEDEQLADVLEGLREGGSRLFWYRDPATGEHRDLRAAELNRTIVEVAGPAFSAKDFRTWGGSREALVARVTGSTPVQAADAAAAALGNTRAVARSSYVHPAVLAATDELLDRVWRSSRSSRRMQRGDRALAKLLSR